jgi:hypothetical protein
MKKSSNIFLRCKIYVAQDGTTIIILFALLNTRKSIDKNVRTWIQFSKKNFDALWPFKTEYSKPSTKTSKIEDKGSPCLIHFYIKSFPSGSIQKKRRCSQIKKLPAPPIYFRNKSFMPMDIKDDGLLYLIKGLFQAWRWKNLCLYPFSSGVKILYLCVYIWWWNYASDLKNNIAGTSGQQEICLLPRRLTMFSFNKSDSLTKLIHHLTCGDFGLAVWNTHYVLSSRSHDQCAVNT